MSLKFRKPIIVSSVLYGIVLRKVYTINFHQTVSQVAVRFKKTTLLPLESRLNTSFKTEYLIPTAIASSENNLVNWYLLYDLFLYFNQITRSSSLQQALMKAIDQSFRSVQYSVCRRVIFFKHPLAFGCHEIFEIQLLEANRDHLVQSSQSFDLFQLPLYLMSTMWSAT